MRLTPLEIRKQEFRKALRGLDPIEVQTFLDMVSEQYESVIEENKTLDRRLIEVEAKLQNYQESEKTLRETLLNVQEVKKQTEESNRRQSDLIKKEAELQAMEIVENARKESRKIQEEINWLKSQKESFINRIRHVLSSQIELLSIMEIDDVVPEEAKQKVEGWNKRKSQAVRSSQTETAELPAEVIDGDSEITADENANGEPETAEKEEKSQTKGGRMIQQFSDTDSEVETKSDNQTKKEEASLNEDDIDDFFKKGIKIDDLIENINKKDLGK